MLIENEEHLEHVEIPHWAGLGGVCYIPSQFLAREDKNDVVNDLFFCCVSFFFTNFDFCRIGQSPKDPVFTLRRI